MRSKSFLQMLEFVEMTEEMKNARHDQCEVPQVADRQLEFLGGGRPWGEQLVDFSCPGNELVLGE